VACIVASASPAWAAEKVLFDNGNSEGVSSGPARGPTFTLAEPHTVTFIFTYHHGHEGGPGTIGLRRQDGTVVGKWPAAGRRGSPKPQWYWEVRPNVKLAPGAYSVFVSLPKTWSFNRKSGGAGIAQVKGVPTTAAPPAPAPCTARPKAPVLRISNVACDPDRGCGGLLRWKAVAGATSYVVGWYAPASPSWSEGLELPAKSVSWTFGGARRGTLYKLAARNACGESPVSNEVRVD
jgi:hypothetical protein